MENEEKIDLKKATHEQLCLILETDHCAATV
jgi:hypothetical protein